MVFGEAACYSNAVRAYSQLHVSKPLTALHLRVLNVFRIMIQDQDILEPEDQRIIEKIKSFIQSRDASFLAAAKILADIIERVSLITYSIVGDGPANVQTQSESERSSRKMLAMWTYLHLHFCLGL